MHSVFRVDGFVIHAREIKHTFDRVENRGVFTNELEGITVTRYNEDLEPLICGLVCKACENVVCLVVVSGDVLDVHRIERFAQQLGLADEFGRRLSPCALVLGILFGSKRLARKIERHGHVSWLFGGENVQHHRDESVNGVCVLAVWRSETIRAERVKSPECQRMTVN